MKNFLSFFLLLILFSCSSEPENKTPKEEPVKEKIVLVPAYSETEAFHSNGVESREFNDEFGATKEEFNEEGKKVKSIFTGETSKTETVFTYSDKGMLIREAEIEDGDEDLVREYIYEDTLLVLKIFRFKDGTADSVTYQYNEKGLLIRMIEEEYVSDYAYDENGLMIRMELKDRTDNNKVLATENYIYNSKGWKIRCDAHADMIGDQVSEWEYDEMGRMVKEKKDYSLGVLHDITYTYDEKGLMKEMIWNKSFSGAAASYQKSESKTIVYKYTFRKKTV